MSVIFQFIQFSCGNIPEANILMQCIVLKEMNENEIFGDILRFFNHFHQSCTLYGHVCFENISKLNMKTM